MRIQKSLFTQMFEGFILRSWWVILFVNLCYIAYEQAQGSRKNFYMTLTHQLKTFTEEKEKALLLQKKLVMQKNSQHDPAWIELTLMEKLGMVPNGYVKVFFSEDP